LSPLLKIDPLDRNWNRKLVSFHRCSYNTRCGFIVTLLIYSLDLYSLQTSNHQELLTYDEVVKEMMIAESKYIRDLNMIIKVLCYFSYHINRMFIAIMLSWITSKSLTNVNKVIFLSTHSYARMFNAQWSYNYII
jgi:hypothetical protein